MEDRYQSQRSKGRADVDIVTVGIHNVFRSQSKRVDVPNYLFSQPPSFLAYGP